jgi:hypothetical protein
MPVRDQSPRPRSHGGSPVYCPRCGEKINGRIRESASVIPKPDLRITIAILACGLTYDAVALASSWFWRASMVPPIWWVVVACWPLSVAVAACHAGLGSRTLRLGFGCVAIVVAGWIIMATYESVSVPYRNTPEAPGVHAAAETVSLMFLNLVSAALGAILGSFLDKPIDRGG